MDGCWDEYKNVQNIVSAQVTINFLNFLLKIKRMKNVTFLNVSVSESRVVGGSPPYQWLRKIQ